MQAVERTDPRLLIDESSLVGCCLLLFGWFPDRQIPEDPGLIWPESFDQAAALLLVDHRAPYRR